MGKRWEISSLQKAFLIAAGLALIAIAAVLLAMPLVSAGVTPVDVEVKNDDELVSVKEDFKTIVTRGLTIVAKTMDIEMFVGQIAEIEFDTSESFIDAFVIDGKGNIMSMHEFSDGEGKIEFFAGEERIVILLATGADEIYGNMNRQEFLKWCKRETARDGRTISSTRSIILDSSVGIAGSSNSGAVIIVKTKVVQPEITSIIGKWDDDGEGLEITGDSNLPRYPEIEWEIFGETGIAKVQRNGKIDFDIDLDGIDTSKDCVLEMRVGNWFEEFVLSLGPRPDTEIGMSIKPKVLPSPKIAPIPLPKPLPTPTPKITRVLADLPTPTPVTLILPALTPTPLLTVAGELILKKWKGITILIIALIMLFAALMRKRK